MLGILGVFIGGGIGSLLRYWVCGRICNHWGVMLVNVIGAFVIGMVFHYFNTRSGIRPEVQMFVMTGLLGGFTTFSTFMLDFGTLINNGRLEEAALYMGGSLIIGIVFLYVGLWSAKAIW